MKDIPIKLTNDQIVGVLGLGSKDLDPAAIREDVLADLVQLGVVDRRTDGTIDFTNVGEKIRDILLREAA